MKESIPIIHSIKLNGMDNVVLLSDYTTEEVHPNKVLMGAINSVLDVVIVVGYTKDGAEFFASSTGNHETTNWLLDVGKMRLIRAYTADEE
jgi:hypothetical protein